jgi:O-antigen/teichoic acid export membrane protein
MILGNTFVALGDSTTPVRINLWTSLVAVALNVVCIRAWGFMGAAWASLLWNLGAWALTDAVLSRRIRPAGRGYVWTIAFLGAALVVGLHTGPALRWLWIAVATIGGIATSPSLRDDARRVWNSQVRARRDRAAG